MPGRPARRGSSGRRQSLAVVPATPADAVPPTPGMAVDLQSPRVSRKVSSFYGGGLPRPSLLADPEQAVMQVMKSQRGRMEFVSPVQALMEWAVTAPVKAGGVAPQWVGKPPLKPLTPQRCFLEDRRAQLLREQPDLKLLTYLEQVRLAMHEGPRHFDGLPFDEQEQYRQYAAADERRYAAECAAYDAANPGWLAFQRRRAAARAAREAARTPPAPPPTAEELWTEAWLAEKEPEAAGRGGEALLAAADAAEEAWAEASNGERSSFERQAEAAQARFEAQLAAWKQRRAAAQEERKQKRRAAATAAADIDAAFDDQRGAADPSDSSESESSDGEDTDEDAAAAAFEAAAAMQGRAGSRGGKRAALSAAAASKAKAVAAAATAAAAARKGKGKAAAALAAPAKGAGKGAAAAAKDDGGRAPVADTPVARRPASADPGLQSPTGKRRQSARTPGSGTPGKRARTAAAAPKRAETQAQGIAMAQKRAVTHHKEAGGRAGAFPSRPERLVGARLENTFATEAGPVTFGGRVTEFLFARITGQGITPLWAVEYEDGDSGEAEWFELKELLVEWPPAGMEGSADSSA